ncbi:MAG TPA: M24 family metallopeptidase [Alphaproteobacteria bacterium]|nr:M24 family metallopeptidase [Alphaproteobacteria bacterium]
MSRMAIVDERLCNPLPIAELERRWRAVRSAMGTAGLDALVVQGANNMSGTGGYFRWFTGISAPSSYSQTLIFPREGLATLVAHGPFSGETTHDGSDPALPGIGRRLSTSAFPAVGYTAAYEPDIVVREIKKAGFRAVGLVGATSAYHGFGQRLTDGLAGIRLVDATDPIDPIRAVKSPDEIGLIRRAAVMQDEIFRKVRDHIRPGLKDFEVMAYAQYVGQTLGSETGYFIGSSAPPGQPAGVRLRPQQGREIKTGDVLFWQAENTGPGGYFVHLARFFVLGRAPQELKDAFSAVRDAQAFTVERLKPGVSCRALFEDYNGYMRGRGFPPETRLHCHSQGYDAVERPLIRHDETMTIGPNMNIGIHPSIGNARVFATICDNFLTHPDGSVERLHKTPPEIVEL